MTTTNGAAPAALAAGDEHQPPALKGFALFSVLAALMLTLFLQALDQTIVSTALPRIVTLHDIEITPVSGRNAVDPTELTLNVTAKTYRYLDDEEQAVATEPKGKAKKDRKGKKKPAADKA